MNKARPCKRDCGYPAAKGRQFCSWHILMRASSGAQAVAATARLCVKPPGYEYVDRIPKSQWPDGERWCAGCQSFVPLFYCSGSRCKACVSMASHARRIEDNYGITPERYEEIFRLQGGRCAICRNVPRTIRFAVDHDHQTGEVRGILCKRCNHDLLGAGHDDILTLWRAVEYLLDPPALRTADRPSRRVLMHALETRLDLAEAMARPRGAEPQDAPF